MLVLPKLPLGCLWNVPVLCHDVRNSFIGVLLNWKLVIVQARLMFILWRGYSEQSPGQRLLQGWMAHEPSEEQRAQVYLCMIYEGAGLLSNMCLGKIARRDWKPLKMTGCLLPRSLPVLPTTALCGQETRPCSRNNSKQKAGVTPLHFCFDMISLCPYHCKWANPHLFILGLKTA